MQKARRGGEEGEVSQTHAGELEEKMTTAPPAMWGGSPLSGQSEITGGMQQQQQQEGEEDATVAPPNNATAATTSTLPFGNSPRWSRLDDGSDVVVVPLSKLLRVLVPPLFISSLSRSAIGFSFPRGNEGRLIGSCLVAATVGLSFMLDTALGAYPALLLVWLMGGTGAIILYNTWRGLAFVKEMCSTCRLRPIIEEHEVMHLNGVRSEEAVWSEARKKYSYDGLGLGTDPEIHSFCPIAKRLKENL
jgi:hypothetical protein